MLGAVGWGRVDRPHDYTGGVSIPNGALVLQLEGSGAQSRTEHVFRLCEVWARSWHDDGRLVIRSKDRLPACP